MRCFWIILIILSLGLFGIGCGGGTTRGKDAGQDGGIDGGTDGGTDGGADQGPVTSRTRIHTTAGGGTTQSANYKARIHIGAPQPYGTASSAEHKVQAGPKPTP